MRWRILTKLGLALLMSSPAAAATLSLDTAVLTIPPARELMVEVLVDTSHGSSEGVVVVDAVIAFDEARFELLEILADDASETDFHYAFSLVSETFPARTIEPDGGQVVVGVPSAAAVPAAQTGVRVAKLRVMPKPLSGTTPVPANFDLVFSVAGTFGESHVVIDDDQGTDVLTTVNGLSLVLDPDWDDDGTPDDVDLDDDGDQMPDDWEEGFGLDPYDASDASIDGDGDGTTNLEEFLAGTDPTTPDGPPAVPLLSRLGIVLLVALLLGSGISRRLRSRSSPSQGVGRLAR